MSTAIRRSLPFVLTVILTMGLAALATVSCSGPRFDYNGAWMGNRNLTIPNTDKYTTYTLGRVTLKVKDNKFELTEMGIPSSGSVSHDDGKIVLHIERVFEKPIAALGQDASKLYPDVTVSPQTDGTILYDNPNAVDHMPLTLKRETQ